MKRGSFYKQNKYTQIKIFEIKLQNTPLWRWWDERKRKICAVFTHFNSKLTFSSIVFSGSLFHNDTSIYVSYFLYFKRYISLKVYNLSSFNLILKYSFIALSKFLYVSVYFNAFCINIKRKHPVKASSSQRNSTCPFYTTQKLYYTPFLSY